MIKHLHLHVIYPADEMRFLQRQFFKEDSFWFVSVSVAVVCVAGALVLTDACWPFAARMGREETDTSPKRCLNTPSSQKDGHCLQRQCLFLLVPADAPDGEYFATTVEVADHSSPVSGYERTCDTPDWL